jgi:hypothetical protein
MQNHAHPGEQIIAFGDDFFSTWPPPPMGVPVPEQPVYSPFPNLGSIFVSNLIEDTVTPYQALYLQKYVGSECIEGQTVCFYSYTTIPAVPIDAELLAPGMIGVEEIIFHVPANQQPGNWPLFFNTGSCPPGSNSSPSAMLQVD